MKQSRLIIENFKGVDLTNQPAGVDISRSCCGTNMIRDVPGKVRKRMGYRLRGSYGGRINGIFYFKDKLIIHAGEEIFCEGSCLRSGASDERSFAVALGEELVFLDGKRALSIRMKDGKMQAVPLDEEAYVPTVTVGRRPSGGGSTLEAINLLSDCVTDSFLGTAEDKKYQLSFDELGEGEIFAKKKTTPGEWQQLKEGVDFTADREAGVITFSAAVGASPVEGEDNLEIRYPLSESRKELINRCRFGICYGAFGAADRVFISGDGQNISRDYHCAPMNPRYFGDLSYGDMGLASSPITGYSIVDGALATHKLQDGDMRNVLLREGEKGESGIEFPVSGIIQGSGAISPYTFAYIKEPLFLTDGGICATTPYEYSGERYIQLRSFYLNGSLLKEQLGDACCCAYGDFYLLAVGERVYVLDTLSKATGASGRSDYQYEGYLLEDIRARTMAFCDGRLLFGDREGNLMEFYSDPDNIESYSDLGEPIKARWDIDFSGSVFYKAKTLRKLAIRLASYANTSVSAYKLQRGVWQELFSDMAGARYFSFRNLSFGKWSFSSDTNPRTVVRRSMVRRADALRISLRNEQNREPFGIFQLALEFSEGGNYKGA